MAKSAVDLAVLSAEAFARLLKDQPLLRDALEAAKQRREAEMEARLTEVAARLGSGAARRDSAAPAAAPQGSGSGLTRECGHPAP